VQGVEDLHVVIAVVQSFPMSARLASLNSSNNISVHSFKPRKAQNSLARLSMETCPRRLMSEHLGITPGVLKEMV